jgi:hypothetical protein
MFENRVLRTIFEPKRDEKIEKWRRLHNDDLYHLYASPNIVGVIRTRRIAWEGHVAFIVARRDAYRLSLETLGIENTWNKWA